MSKKFLFYSFLLFFSAQYINCQSIDSTLFTLNTRLSFYTFEKSGEVLLRIHQSLIYSNLKIVLKVDNSIVGSWKGKPGKELIRVPFIIDLQPSRYKIDTEISIPGSRIKYLASSELIILKYKSNEVKTDRLTGGLIVNKKSFFPFGFYCYSPVYPTLPEEEVVKGFNMISPYQKIMPQTIKERKSYMDRCAQLGMKVHFNLLSVSGGGGTGSKIEGLTSQQKLDLLLNEINTFKDHPALLAWYIADEPTGNSITPDSLIKIYNIIRKEDPWHPISVVFMAPFLSSKKYADALDIVMADPYPVPDLPVSFVGDITRSLTSEFKGKKPVWIVPQAFGGGELWLREPTLQEIRSMTYQAIINGATGIQYFIRQGLNLFPKSASTWDECGRMAVEVAELTPWLLSDEETIAVESKSNYIIASSKLHYGKLIVMAVNKINKPVEAEIRVNGLDNGKAILLFENRSVNLTGGVIKDHLAPFGSQVYLINIVTEKPAKEVSNINLIKDPGFEDIFSPGIPSACYARPGDDRGATYFLDTREHTEGNHSLRIVTPGNENSLYLRFFPFEVKAGATYTISIKAKSDPEQRFFYVTKQENNSLNEKKAMPQFVEILLGDFGRARFIPDDKWRRFVTFVTIPSDTLAAFKTNLILKMPGQGVAWFDQIKVFEEKPSN